MSSSNLKGKVKKISKLKRSKTHLKVHEMKLVSINHLFNIDCINELTYLSSPYTYETHITSEKATMMIGKSIPKSLNNWIKYSPILVANAIPGMNIVKARSTVV